MRRIASLTILCIVLVSLNTAHAQSDKPKCAPAEVIKAASALKASGDTKADMAALVKLRGRIDAANVACNGMSFEGKGRKVTSPFVLNKGLYKVTAHMLGDEYSAITAELNPIDGGDMFHACETGTVSGLFLADRDGAETSLRIGVDSCRAVLTVSVSNASWRIDIEPLQ